MEVQQALFERAKEYWKMLAIDADEVMLMTPDDLKIEMAMMIESSKTDTTAE